MELTPSNTFTIASPSQGAVAADEALVADARAGLSPAQMVERKLATLLRSQPLSVSHLMTSRRTSRNP